MDQPNAPADTPALTVTFVAECEELARPILGRGFAMFSDRSTSRDLAPNDEMMVRVGKLLGRKVHVDEHVGAVGWELHEKRKAAI